MYDQKIQMLFFMIFVLCFFLRFFLIQKKKCFDKTVKSKTLNGLFQKKSSVEDINGNFERGRAKVVGIPGGYVKI